MTQKNKELLLKDLSVRLPYGVKCKYNCVVQVGTLVAGKTNFIGELNGIVPLHNGHIGFMVDCDKVDALEGDIKPYLRPMSSMTEEEQKEFVHFHCINLCPVIINDMLTLDNESKMFDWLNAHHFDYRGLIDKGLAIEVTEENNPYKE